MLAHFWQADTSIYIKAASTCGAEQLFCGESTVLERWRQAVERNCARTSGKLTVRLLLAANRSSLVGRTGGEFMTGIRWHKDKSTHATVQYTGAETTTVILVVPAFPVVLAFPVVRTSGSSFLVIPSSGRGQVFSCDSDQSKSNENKKGERTEQILAQCLLP